MDNVLAELRWRGLIEDVTSPDLEPTAGAPLTLYAGFDPTSTSLQVGNLVTIMVLMHFQRHGHRVIALVGGATGMIGDPSGKAAERALLGAADIERNVAGIRENLGRFLDFNHPTTAATLVNNHDWLGAFSFIHFLRDVGKHFRVGAMLAKESVRARLAGEAGMSFTEFSYQLLQAYDFLHLHDVAGCTLQVGGSDQWGNITAGIELVRKLRGTEVFGLTFPLVCDSAGQKFGKSAGNAVYLDAARTSCYAFYQFFLRQADADVARLLKIFTFLPRERIEALEAAVRERPDAREAQRALAEEVTRLVHGADGLAAAQRATAALFGAELDGLRADELLEVFRDVPSAEIARAAVIGQPLVDVAVAAGLCKSKGEARRLVQSGGLYLNNRRVADIGAQVGPADLIEDRLLVLRSGKRTYALVKGA